MLPIKIELPKQFFEEETRCNYKISVQKKRLWAVLLDLLLEFDRVCKKYNIKYSLDSGTLLGAVRHKGFIPWDDDMDVIMFRSEYNKLCQVASKEFKYPYFWQNNDTDPGSARRHAQLRNSATTGILKSEMENGHPVYSFNQGLFLDVFILDEIPDSKKELKTLRKNLVIHISILNELRNIVYTNGYNNKWVQDMLIQESHFFDAMVSQYNGSGQKRVANLSLNPRRKKSTLFDVRLFSDYVDCEFEKFIFPAFRGKDIILTGYYNDWHKFVIGTAMHGGLFVDTENPYTNYIVNNNSSSSKEDNAQMPILAELLYQRNMARKELNKYKAIQNCIMKISNRINKSIRTSKERNNDTQ